MNKRIMIILIVVTVLGCARSPALFLSERNSVAYLAEDYGVSKESVEAVAHAFGVDPTDLARYGDEPFPLNYIRHTLGWALDQSDHPKIYRTEIDALMTGYVSRCDLENTVTLYLFYSDWLRPKTLFRGEALPLKISYELDVSQNRVHGDQIVQSITYYELGDSGGLLWENVASQCEPPARH